MTPEYPRFPHADSYARSFADPVFWGAMVRAAGAVCGEAVNKVSPVGDPGTNPVFEVGGGRLVKLFTPFFGGRAQRGAEAGAYRALVAAPGVPLARLLAEGAVFPGHPDWDWPFLILERVPGRSLEAEWAGLSPAQRERVAHDLGAVLRALHDCPLAAPIGPDFSAHVCEARGRVRDELALMGTVPAGLIDQAEGYVEEYVPRGRALLHSDLDGYHVLGRLEAGRWTIQAVIDFGDAKTGDPAYDWPAMHLGLFRGDRGLLAHALSGYGANPWAPDDWRRATQVSLLHDWDVLKEPFRHLPGLAQAPDWDTVAERLWGPP